MTPNKLLLSISDLQTALGISERTLWRMASAGKLPASIKIGKLRRWRRSDVDAWIHAGCPDCNDGADGAGGRQ